VGTTQFILVALKPDTFAALQTNIAASGSYPARYDLTPVEYPIIFRENGDWTQYIDEYHANPFPPPSTLPDTPGISIIDTAGKFYAIRHGSYDVHAGIDWVVRTVDELLGGRQPVDTILALDRSGSMSSPPPSGASDPKISILKDAVGVFLDVWEANAVTKDRVGVVDFSDTVHQYSHPVTGAHLVPLATDSLAVRSYISSLSAGGWTCMGGAVAKGLDKLASSARRHIILFSDGMQNYNPVLADVGWPLQILNVAPAAVGSYTMVTGIHGDSGVPPKTGQDLNSFDTHIHTIGVGLPGSPWTDLMSRVAVQTYGLHFHTPAPEVDRQNCYVNDLLESFKGATPQLAQYTLGTYDPEESYAQDNCWINSTARWLTVVLSWQGNPDENRLLCNLEAPDGTVIEIHGRTRTAPRRRIISMPLPSYHYDRLVKHAGKWRLHIMGTTKAAVPYQVFWIVDDRRVQFDIEPVDRVYRVGDTFPVKARLLQDGEPLPPARIEEATVRAASPAVDLRAFLSDYHIDPAEFERMKKKMIELGLTSEDEFKLHILCRDKDAVARCTATRVRSIPMKLLRGDWVARFTFEIAGIHRFDLHMTALDDEKQPIVRARTLNVFVEESETQDLPSSETGA
jgi:hypothetical protein